MEIMWLFDIVYSFKEAKVFKLRLSYIQRNLIENDMNFYVFNPTAS